MIQLDHKHIIVDAVIRKPITSETQAVEWLRRVIDAVGMKIVIGPHAHYCTAQDNEGITATCCIETSHASLHIWDKIEKPILKFDLYSCATFEVSAVLDMIKEFDPETLHYILLDRNVHAVTIGWNLFEF